jgi:hypothetical protein
MCIEGGVYTRAFKLRPKETNESYETKKIQFMTTERVIQGLKQL